MAKRKSELTKRMVAADKQANEFSMLISDLRNDMGQIGHALGYAKEALKWTLAGCPPPVSLGNDFDIDEVKRALECVTDALKLVGEDDDYIG